MANDGAWRQRWQPWLGRRGWPAAAVLALLAACQTTQLSPDDEAKRARWHSIDPVDVGFDAPFLVQPPVTKAERRIRHEGVIEERLTLGVADGRIDIVHAAKASFEDAIDQHLDNPEFFLARLIEAFDARYDGHRQLREIHHRVHPSKGFAALVDLKERRGPCVFAIVGYRMKGGAIHAADFGNMDTLVRVSHCGPTVKFDAFAAMLETMEAVTDREAFTEALRRKLNAVPGRFRGGGRRI